VRHNLTIRNDFLDVISTEVERSLQYKKVIAKNTVGLRPTDQTKMSQGSILSVLNKRIEISPLRSK